MDEAIIDRSFNCNLIDKCYYIDNGKIYNINKQFGDEVGDRFEVGNRLVITYEDIFRKTKVAGSDEIIDMKFCDKLEKYNVAHKYSTAFAHKIDDYSYFFDNNRVHSSNFFDIYEEINHISSNTNITDLYLYGDYYNIGKINLDNVRTIKIGCQPTNFSFSEMENISTIMIHSEDLYYCTKYPKYLIIIASGYYTFYDKSFFVIKTHQPIGPKSARK